MQGTKIFQYCTCPVRPVTYNFHSSCKHMHLPFKSVCNKEHKGVICNMTPMSYSSCRTSALGKFTRFFLDYIIFLFHNHDAIEQVDLDTQKFYSRILNNK